jgi:hypothetical protein
MRRRALTEVASSVIVCSVVACAPTRPDAAYLADALGNLDLAACDRITDAAIADECVAGVVRADPTAAPEACGAVRDPRWAGECWFTVAERLGAGGDRSGALAACAQAGPFYDECLFHLWTAELDALTSGSDDLSAVIAEGAPVIEFWSGVQTVEGDVEALLQDELVFRWMRLHRPVPMDACPVADEVCLRGHQMFLVRSLAEDLLRAGTAPGRRDRVCRQGVIEPAAVDGLTQSDVDWEPVLAEVLAIACEPDARRPWNPVFRVRR